MSNQWFLILILMLFMVSGCNAYNDISQSVKQDKVIEVNDFCGASTEYACEADDDCIISGCSGQICKGKAEEQSITTCEYQDCYDAKKYNLTCGCDTGSCRWMNSQV